MSLAARFVLLTAGPDAKLIATTSLLRLSTLPSGVRAFVHAGSAARFPPVTARSLLLVSQFHVDGKFWREERASLQLENSERWYRCYVSDDSSLPGAIVAAELERFNFNSTAFDFAAFLPGLRSLEW